MSSASPTPAAAPSRPPRPSTRQGLLGRKRGFLGITGDQFAKFVFRGNAAISIIVLGLITWTIFQDAAGFIPQNKRNLEIYRLAGLEYVDILKAQINRHRDLGRLLNDVRGERIAELVAQGMPAPQANAKLASSEEFSGRLDDTISPLQDILSEMTDTVTSLKERQKVAQDFTEARAHLEAALRTAPESRKAAIEDQLKEMNPEQIDFAAEIKPLLARIPEIKAANEKLGTDLDALLTEKISDDPAMVSRLGGFKARLKSYRDSLPQTAEKMASWDQNKPVSWWESFHAFAFGRQWITASFWQDWYGILPLLCGSLLISFLALLIAIPLGVAAAIYVNQVASPVEQRFIKPTIEFISAIPSVVLGFFGIAVLGETLRKLSQLPSLSWMPGFPIIERLNATTAACLLALMAVPTIFTLAEDAINNVPRSFKEASFALGATRLQTIVNIVVPASLSGIVAAILLGFGRVVGETMVVLLCAGNRIEIPDFGLGLGAFFQPVHTMTGIIAQEMGEVVRGSIHYRALFMVGVVLFLISLLINWLAQKIVRRYRISIG